MTNRSRNRISLTTLVVAALLCGVGAATYAAQRSSKPTPTINTPKLQRDWVWKKKTIDFDPMYAR